MLLPQIGRMNMTTAVADPCYRAARSGVRYVVQTGGSSRDEGIIRAADEYGMVMVFTGLRLFHH